MNSNLVRGFAAAVAIATLGACGGNADQAKLESAAGALTQQRDSSVKAIDSSKTLRQVDTSRLGAAKTESILTKARKNP